MLHNSKTELNHIIDPMDVIASELFDLFEPVLQSVSVNIKRFCGG